MTQQHVVCMSDKHPLAKKDSIDWEDLQYEPLILMKKIPGIEKRLLKNVQSEEFIHIFFYHQTGFKPT